MNTECQNFSTVFVNKASKSKIVRRHHKEMAQYTVNVEFLTTGMGGLSYFVAYMIHWLVRHAALYKQTNKLEI